MNEYKCKKCGRSITDYEQHYKNGLCFWCYELGQRANQAESLQNNEETETYAEDCVICPWCGYRIEEDGDCYFINEGEGEYECPECGKEFCFSTEQTVTYNTWRKDETI